MGPSPINQHFIEKLLQDIWNRCVKNQPQNIDTWLHFLHQFFPNRTIEKGGNSTITSGLDLIAKVEEIFVFLSNCLPDSRKIFTKIDRSNESLQLKSNSTKIVLCLSPSSIDLLVNSPQSQFYKGVKIIRFPKGKIPNYFLDLISSNKGSAKTLLKTITDVSRIELEFTNELFSRLGEIKSKPEKKLIYLTTILLILNEFKKYSILNDFKESNFSNSKNCSLNEIILTIRKIMNKYEFKTELIEVLFDSLDELEVQNFQVDFDLIESVLNRYSFTLDEPSLSTQEVAISPRTLSTIIEIISTNLANIKKEGKFYTKLNEIEFISHLALYRLLELKITNVDSNYLINCIFKDWENNNRKSLKLFEPNFILPFIRILNPACGTGGFLVSITRLIGNLIDEQIIQEGIKLELWGIDTDKIAIIITRLRLIFLKMNLKQRKFEAPLQFSAKNIKLCNFLTYNIPISFDLVLGNPPWVRHEDIGIEKQSRYKESLINRLKIIYGSSLVLDQKSDLYIYFCLISLSLLNKKGGILSFLTSNAWLEV
ncbi:MAG: Eco57I restriction-modification methylase domain-containing protein, partial [Candidatus Thorarchaeota archaeon]